MDSEVVIAVEGCCHGELDEIYKAVRNLEVSRRTKVDLLLICGDFQAVRNPADLQTMAVPPKFRTLGTFWKYYFGEIVAPIPTIFIGGNHEASSHLWELPFGGWVAPNIYYMGHCGVVTFGGYRIAGLSGIYKSRDYVLGHYERPPFDDNTMRSIYHTRSFDVFRLKLLTGKIDCCFSHDWPSGVWQYGDVEQLLRFKPYFRDDISSGQLGSVPAMEVLRTLKPTHWFSAHLHAQFIAKVTHDSDSLVPSVTNFLALDKCLPRRRFLELVHLGKATGPKMLSYDAEWLAILRKTDRIYPIDRRRVVLPPASSMQPNADEVEEARRCFHGDLRIQENFHQVAARGVAARSSWDVPILINPQTTSLCTTLSVHNPCDETRAVSQVEFCDFQSAPHLPVVNNDEIALDLDDEDEQPVQVKRALNPEVIDLGHGDDVIESRTISANGDGACVVDGSPQSGEAKRARAAL